MRDTATISNPGKLAICLKQRREALKMTSVQLADRANCPPQLISDIEDGLLSDDDIALSNIANVLVLGAKDVLELRDQTAQKRKDPPKPEEKPVSKVGLVKPRVIPTDVALKIALETPPQPRPTLSMKYTKLAPVERADGSRPSPSADVNVRKRTPDGLRTALGLRIFDRRAELNIKQWNIADRCQLSKGTISRFERDTLPSDEIIPRLAKALDMSARELFDLKVEDGGNVDPRWLNGKPEQKPAAHEPIRPLAIAQDQSKPESRPERPNNAPRAIPESPVHIQIPKTPPADHWQQTIDALLNKQNVIDEQMEFLQRCIDELEKLAKEYREARKARGSIQ